MTKDLEKFYNECITILDENLTEYKDEKGNYSILPTAGILVSVDYNELNKQQYDVAVFNQDIPKDFKATITKVKKAVCKYDITHKEEDRFTLVEKEEDVRQVWFVMNNLKIKKAFNKKEDALELAEKINKKIIDKIKK